MTKHFTKNLNISSEIRKSLNQYPSLQEFWNSCKRGDWMLELLYKNIKNKDNKYLRRMTLAKVKCAELVLHLMKDERSIKAIHTAKMFAYGFATREELKAAVAAAAAADAGAYAAAADAAAGAYAAAADAGAAAVAAAGAAAVAAAAAAAAVAAAGAYAAAWADAGAAAVAAADAAYAAAAAAAAAYAADSKSKDKVRNKVLKQCADIVREVYPNINEFVKQ